MMLLKIQRAFWLVVKRVAKVFDSVTWILSKCLLGRTLWYQLFSFARDKEEMCKYTLMELKGTYVSWLHDHKNPVCINFVSADSPRSKEIEQVAKDAEETASKWESQEELLAAARENPTGNPLIRARTMKENKELSQTQRNEYLKNVNHTATTNSNVVKLSSHSKKENKSGE